MEQRREKKTNMSGNKYSPSAKLTRNKVGCEETAGIQLYRFGQSDSDVVLGMAELAQERVTAEEPPNASDAPPEVSLLLPVSTNPPTTLTSCGTPSVISQVGDYSGVVLLGDDALAKAATTVVKTVKAGLLASQVEVVADMEKVSLKLFPGLGISAYALASLADAATLTAATQQHDTGAEVGASVALVGDCLSTAGSALGIMGGALAPVGLALNLIGDFLSEAGSLISHCWHLIRRFWSVSKIVLRKEFTMKGACYA